MMKKYLVQMSYQIQLEAETEADAIQRAQFQSVYGEERVCGLEQRVVRVIEEAQAPKLVREPKALQEIAATPQVAEASDIPF